MAKGCKNSGVECGKTGEKRNFWMMEIRVFFGKGQKKLRLRLFVDKTGLPPV